MNKKQYNKIWRKKNPDKVKASRNRWKKKNPDKVREATKRWTEKNRDRVKKYQRKYWRKYYILYRDKLRKYGREYSLFHPRKRNGSHNWKNYPIKELIKRDGRKCKKCGAIKYLTINHKIPRIVYNDKGNIWDVPLKELEILCSKCNNEHYQQLVKKALRFYFSRKLKINY